MIWDLVRDVLAKLRAEPELPPGLPGVEFHDRRKMAAQSHHGYATRRRSISRVTAIVLHQTGCVMGERPARYDGMGAHVGVTRCGRVIWLHDWDRTVVAANGLNGSTVSIEIDGLYAGIEGDDSTVWDNPRTPTRERGMVLTPEAAKAAREVIAWIVEDVRRRGGAVTAIRAHREASASRRSDPGEAIWKQVALMAADELGLGTGGDVLGDGRPVPREWDATSGHRY